jgi:hypothetical protein
MVVVFLDCDKPKKTNMNQISKINHQSTQCGRINLKNTKLNG